MSKRIRPGRKERAFIKALTFDARAARLEADNASRICERSPLRSSSDRVNLKVHSGAGFVEARARLRAIPKAFLPR